jgi:hypothetical protein
MTPQFRLDTYQKSANISNRPEFDANQTQLFSASTLQTIADIRGNISTLLGSLNTAMFTYTPAPSGPSDPRRAASVTQYSALLQSALDQIDVIFGAANTSMKFVFEDNRNQLKLATTILANDTKNVLDYVPTTITVADAALNQTAIFIDTTRTLVKEFTFKKNF